MMKEIKDFQKQQEAKKAAEAKRLADIDERHIRQMEAILLRFPVQQLLDEVRRDVWGGLGTVCPVERSVQQVGWQLRYQYEDIAYHHTNPYSDYDTVTPYKTTVAASFTITIRPTVEYQSGVLIESPSFVLVINNEATVDPTQSNAQLRLRQAVIEVCSNHILTKMPLPNQLREEARKRIQANRGLKFWW